MMWQCVHEKGYYCREFGLKNLSCLSSARGVLKCMSPKRSFAYIKTPFNNPCSFLYRLVFHLAFSVIKRESSFLNVDPTCKQYMFYVKHLYIQSGRHQQYYIKGNIMLAAHFTPVVAHTDLPR